MTELDDDIREIATSIWETLFTVPLDRDAGADKVTSPVVTGCVQIEGAWNGAVMLQCGEDLAGQLAGELFQSAVPTPDDVRDTLGELTNMLAGNIKALLPEPSRISLPAVAVGAADALTVIGTGTVATVLFRCGGSPLVVTLVQSVSEDAA